MWRKSSQGTENSLDSSEPAWNGERGSAITADGAQGRGSETVSALRRKGSAEIYSWVQHPLRRTTQRSLTTFRSTEELKVLKKIKPLLLQGELHMHAKCSGPCPHIHQKGWDILFHPHPPLTTPISQNEQHNRN